MKFTETKIQGAFIIDLEPFEDVRGYFARGFCREEFLRHGIDFTVVQANLSGSARRGTLRGLHYQAPPYQEDKLVRVIHGAVFDVAVDLRPASATYGQWFGLKLSRSNKRSFLIPRGCAHGQLSLTDDVEFLYLVSESFHPESDRGLRWDDPFCNITWPIAPQILSDKDLAWPDFQPEHKNEK